MEGRKVNKICNNEQVIFEGSLDLVFSGDILGNFMLYI